MGRAGQDALGQAVAIGITDTDDAIDEVKAGHDGAIIFPDATARPTRMGTLFIPNTLASSGLPQPRRGGN